jgi:hypothetical protein
VKVLQKPKLLVQKIDVVMDGFPGEAFARSKDFQN